MCIVDTHTVDCMHWSAENYTELILLSLLCMICWGQTQRTRLVQKVPFLTEHLLGFNYRTFI